MYIYLTVSVIIGLGDKMVNQTSKPKKKVQHSSGNYKKTSSLQSTHKRTVNSSQKKKSTTVNKVPVKKKKKKKKYKLSAVGVVSIVLIFIIVDFIFIKMVIKSSDINKENQEIEIKEKEKENNNGETEENTDEKDDSEDTGEVTEEKLNELNHINEKISFFKNEKIDRYISYMKKNPDMDIEKIIVYVNIGLDKSFYTNIKESPKQNTSQVLTNKYYSLSKNYEPKSLVSINSNYSSRNLKMVKDAADAFNEMAKAAKEDGFTIRATSTYRSYYYQKDLYNNYVAEDGVKKADTYSARPGHSEHQTGYAVDVDNKVKEYTEFGTTKEYTWMKENAYKYGFILRYTKENEWITGYKEEPWHYRYVGKEIAKYIQENPMTYEEYYVRFLDN